ncbi:hypothetical protein GcM1_234041 [Golovinomyces cichoracearum]|uniref:Uncharacterized protein n=1 Tax=Golovinomyces cichoracearum TaxID=62708 RepID=A0A420ILA7_9PEZI|nr:hypothetical protein GcM1_234041 [Golovinomyces cichoracearum]
MDSTDSFILRRQLSTDHLLRRSGSSGSNCGPNPCEKPTSSSTFTLPIILGIAVPLVGAAILFLILQRRHVRKIREEDADDRHASLDFGLGDTSNLQSSNKTSIQSMKDEKSGLSHRQVSLNMSMNNPYLVSLDSKNSKDSLDSLSLSLRKEDPYRPVSKFLASDTASNKPQKRPSSPVNNSPNDSQTSLNDTRNSSNASTNSRNKPANAAIFPPRYNSLHYQQVDTNDQGLPNQNGFPTELPQAHISPEATISTNGWASGRPLNQQLQHQPLIGHENNNSFGANQNFRTNDYQNIDQNHAFDPAAYYEGERTQYTNNPTELRNQAQSQFYTANNFTYEPMNGDPSSGQYPSNAEYMYESQYPTEDQVGGVDLSYNISRSNNRLSVMQARPLPPNAITDSDDPEIRANRIRSFYKEYFDDSSSMPNGTYEKRNHLNHNDESVYYDPDSNQFVLPYSQPVTRRAITPPPANNSMRPTRPRNGSMGTMNYVENRSRYHPPEAQPHSSTNESHQVNLRKPTLPFSDLNQMPTPGNIGNDVLNMRSYGHVPPMVYRGQNGFSSERQRIPNANPLSYEPSPIPSPHLLEKEGTYSPLSFAPPKKFRETDNSSDAGSIRSNHSAKVGVNNGMPRNVSNRIDHLPEDVVFTKDCLNSSLKPQWDMSR